MEKNKFGSRIPLIYILIAVPIVIANAFILGPFQAADEGSHFFRIVQLSHGYIIGQNDAKRGPGGNVDTSLVDVPESFNYLPFQKDHKVNSDSVQKIRRTFWSWPDKSYKSFNNTVIYPPYFYLPAVLAAKISQFLGTSIMDALTLARLAQGLASIILAYFALRLAQYGRLTLFALLCLPMTLSLTGSASQDGVLISSLALVFALLTGPNPMAPLSKIAVSVIIGAAVAAKPPYFPLFFLFLLPTFSQKTQIDGYLEKASWALLSFCVAISWIANGLMPMKVPFLPEHGVSASEQLRFLISQPTFVFHLVYETLRTQFWKYAQEFVGVLGWLDTQFSPNTYFFYGLFLGASVAGDLIVGGNNLSPLGRLLVACAILLSIGAVFMAIYMGITGVGQEIVRGVQGRYFIPLALFLPAAFTPQRALVAGKFQSARIFLEALPVLGAYGLWVVPRALMSRYWG